jgi:hypothetical protein
LFVFSSILLWSCQAQQNNKQQQQQQQKNPTSEPSQSPSAVPTVLPKKEKATGATGATGGGGGGGGGGGNNPFCRNPGTSNENPLETCKSKDQAWSGISSSNGDLTFHQRHLTGECGPDCRPSCVTLLLDLDKLNYQEELKCQADQLCQCQFNKSNECQGNKLDALFTEHPKCYLEDADCLGPTVYDDNVHYTQRLAVLADIELPEMERCGSIPDNELYCRFRDWKVVHPITDYTCNDENCINPDSKIYFEYCNIIEEDPACDNCNDDKCGKKCKKIVEPFPPGWTTFVVSAPISYPRELASASDTCGKALEYADTTGQACFLQRIEIYYPPEDADCSAGCPNCHDCPLLELGDTFGPLEVVGFGHGLVSDEQECAACDKKSALECTSSTRDLDCDDIFNCHKAVDCATGEPLGLPVFADNQCSYQNAGTRTGSSTDSTSDLDRNDSSDNGSDRGGFSAATQGIHSQNNSDDDKSTLITALGVGLGVVAMLVASVFLRRRARAKWNTKSAATSTAAKNSTSTTAKNNSTSTNTNNNNNNKEHVAGEGTVDAHSSSHSSQSFRQCAITMLTEGDNDVEAVHMVGESKLVPGG